jgi:hypothetical protein
MKQLDDLHVLKTLDPATTDADPHSPRARAGLQRILADPGATSAPLRVDRPRRYGARIAVAGGLLVAAVAAMIVVPSTFGRDAAFATWTADPAALSSADSARAAESCRDEQGSGSPDYGQELAAATTAISERRGAWTLVVLAGHDGFSALCISDQPKPLFQSYFGSIGTTPAAARPGPRALTATNLGTGEIDGNELSVAVGHAGADVRTVSYRSPSRGKISASVAAGQFALWLPGDELEGASRRGVPLEVTYRDGTTATLTVAL